MPSDDEGSMRRLLVCLTLLCALTGCGSGGEPGAAPAAPPESDGLLVPARVEGRLIEVASGDAYTPLFVGGVNLGSTVPGSQPGELPATREQYDRWVWEMGRLGANTVRVYTIMRPVFYDALR